MKNKLKTIIGHYGIRKQLKHFQTEVFELTEAILNEETKPLARVVIDQINRLFDGKTNNIEHITEEIADVLVMLEQFRLYYNIPTEDVKKVFIEKTDRQIKRI